MNESEQTHPLVEGKAPTETVAEATRPSLIPATNEFPAFTSERSNHAKYSVELHIEELALHGFDPGDRYGLGDAIERELRRMLTEQGLPPTITENAAIAYVDGGSIDMSARSDVETIAARLARAVYGGFKQ